MQSIIHNPLFDIADISSYFCTAESGFTIKQINVYKEEKKIFGNIVLECTNAIVRTTKVLTIASSYLPAASINGFCIVSEGEWDGDNMIPGYLFISKTTGEVQCGAPSTNTRKIIKLSINYKTP